VCYPEPPGAIQFVSPDCCGYFVHPVSGNGGDGGMTVSAPPWVPPQSDAFPAWVVAVGTDAMAIAAGINEYTRVFDKHWLGQNGKWNSLNWGGNQWTGARLSVVQKAEFWRAASKGFFAASAVLNVVDGLNAAVEGDNFGVATASSNIGWAAAGVWGGPAGWAGASTYTLTSWALQIPAVYDVLITAPLDFVCARSSGC
jgi:hypothetical protein